MVVLLVLFSSYSLRFNSNVDVFIICLIEIAPLSSYRLMQACGSKLLRFVTGGRVADVHFVTLCYRRSDARCLFCYRLMQAMWFQIVTFCYRRLGGRCSFSYALLQVGVGMWFRNVTFCYSSAPGAYCDSS